MKEKINIYNKEAKPMRTVRKTTIELPDDLYFYLQEKALTLKKQSNSKERVSMISIIRELIQKDKEFSKKR